jgi:signal transduction histidine kinase
MIAAARGQVGSLRWRLLIGALFAVGASFVLDSFQIGLGWFLALALSMGFDAMLGHSYLEARGHGQRRSGGVMFVWGCIFSIMIFAAMPIILAAWGAGPGRVLGVLMAASSLVSVMLFFFQAPRFMLISAAPATVALLAIPFIPSGVSQTDALHEAAGVACGVAGFLAYIGRSALTNGKMVEGWKAAHKAAKERQLEAEAKRAEAEEASRAKSEFLAVMTHELRTPLNAVIGYAEIINEDMQAEGRTELAGDAARITASARHLLGLIDQILNMSSVDAGAEGLAPRDFDVRKLIDDAVGLIQEDARAAGNRISLRVGAEAEFAHNDAKMLAVCVSALLSNAAKFTQNGLIAITAERELSAGQEWLTIAVSDTGVGVAAEDLPRIFSPFTQLEASRTRAQGGLGLGLSVAKRMANTMGGDVSATSQRGAGSTFTVRVPLRIAHARAAAQAAAA